MVAPNFGSTSASNSLLRMVGPSSSSKINVKTALSHFMVGLCCFYLGLLMNMTTHPDASSCSECPSCPKCPPCEARKASVVNEDDPTFPASMKNFLQDFGTVSKTEINELLKIGVPMDEPKRGGGDEHALILYPTESSLPDHPSFLNMSAEKATENCMSVKMVLQDIKPRKRQCLVIMPQWESYHVHKFMRLTNKEREYEDIKTPLRYVSLSHTEKGTFNGVPELKSHTLPFYQTLSEYLTNLDRVTADLKERLDKLNSKTIIVLVCNLGQSELLHNFVCNAKAKGLDLSSIFLFATDQKTFELAESLGIAAMHDESVFAEMPEKAAGSYGDRTFAKMMMAKVYCVHLVLHCGYNVLFQDVDVIWNQNPLPFLESDEYKEWDMMFQDDGARSIRYTPYSPNTGFYFVRNNQKTLYMFSMLLRHGDYILKVKSHQAALVAVMNEHISWKGLRVMTFPRGPNNLFPGGAEFHRYKDAMKKWITSPEDKKPTIFHMSWTTNKNNKKLYYEQMGEWYTGGGSCNGLDCCLKEPEVTCHYRDKPSSKYCGMVDPIDKGRASFWKNEGEIETLKKKYRN